MSIAISIIEDEEEITETDCFIGALPAREITDRTGRVHSPSCMSCGRPMGPVAAPGVTQFDLGVKHALNRLTQLIAAVPGISQGEACAIVLRLQERDVEL